MSSHEVMWEDVHVAKTQTGGESEHENKWEERENMSVGVSGWGRVRRNLTRGKDIG